MSSISDTALRGRIAEVHLRKENGWTIGTLEQDGRGELVPVVGVMQAAVGDNVELRGKWAKHPRYGQQFKSISCIVSMPVSDEGAIKWFASRFPNIGAARARQMVELCGGAEQVYATIENDPELLMQVKGITPNLISKIVDVYSRFKHERDAVVTLLSWDMTPMQATAAINAYGADSVIGAIRADPYEVIMTVPRFGWKRADQLARNLGIGLEDPRRIDAALVDVVRVACQAGHTYVSVRKAAAIAARTRLEIPETTVIEHARAKGRVVRGLERITVASRTSPGQILPAFALPHIHRFEKGTVASVQRLLEEATK